MVFNHTWTIFFVSLWLLLFYIYPQHNKPGHTLDIMFGSLSEEVEVKVAAEKAWELYGTIKLGDIAAKHILERLDVIEGDGGVGTIVKVTFKPGICYYHRNY